MKKFICLTLILLLVVSLSACGASKEEQLSKELGISQEELSELQQELKKEQGSTEAPQESDLLQKVKPYVGKWVSLDRSTTIELFPDGAYLYQSPEDDYSMDGYINAMDDTFTFMGGMEVRQLNGVDCISSWKFNALGAKYVREEEYDQVVEIVNLTPDNVLDYFEQRIVRQADLDDFGEVTGMSFETGYFLKDEYADRLGLGSGTLRIFYREHEYQLSNPKSADFQVPELDPAGAPLDHEQSSDIHLVNKYYVKNEDKSVIDETLGTILFKVGARYQYVTEDPLPIDVIDEVEIQNVVGQLYLVG